MTQLEIERLVRKISDFLQQGGHSEIVPKLAADYAAACQTVNLRLQQCEGMIKAGDRPQAIQLAETTPNLLDLVTALEFHGCDEWRGYCRQNSLPIANRIDVRSVQTLNQCYEQGIATDHPLYTAYRRAVLNRDDQEALKTLQSIVRLNPADTNAASELARLDGKVLAARLQHLGESVKGADPALLVAEIEAIEAFGFKHKPEGEIWGQAQAVRCDVLLQQAEKLKQDSRWLDALAKIDFIRQLQKESNLQFSPASAAKLAGVESWAQGEEAKDKKERQFQSLLGELQRQIQRSEEKDTSARFVKLPELRDDYEALNKVWRELTDFTRPLPEAATAAFRKRSALLEGEIARRTAIQRRLVLAGSALVLAVGALITWLVLGQMKAADFSKQVQTAINQRQVRAAEKLLERAHAEKLGSAQTVSSAETFVSKEQALLANFEATYARLPRQLPGTPDARSLSGIADELAGAHVALNALAPDLKAEKEPQLQAFERQWQTFLAESTATVNELFAQWVAAAEQKCGDLDYRADLGKSTAQLADLARMVQKITDTESGFTNHLNLRSDLMLRADAVSAKFATFDRERQKLDDGYAAIKKAHSIKEYADGISLIISSEFSASPIGVAALQIQSLNASEEATLRSLLCATNAGAWAFLQKTKTPHLVPEVVMPAERAIFEQLNSDPAVSGLHRRYRLTLDPEGRNTVIWITSGAFEPALGWKKIAACTWAESMTAAAFEEREYGYFDGQYKLSASQPLYRVEQLVQADETAAFNSVGLEKVLTPGDVYSKPLLEVLDSLKASTNGSASFRAYLFITLANVMQLQPQGWGLAFCPAVQKDKAQIKAVVGDDFNSGDWFVPAKADAYSKKLDQLFTAARSISYVKQADGLLALARAVAKDGMHFVGFVDLDGKPNYFSDAVAGEVYGFTAADKLPRLMAAKADSALALKEKALPLSPLFALDAPRKEYLGKAEVDPGNASFQGVLPPLFQQLP